MKSWALLSSNLPSVIDRSNLSMTRGKLLDSDTQLFIFISILIMTKLHPRDPENRQQNRFSERRFSVELGTGHYRRIIPVRVR